jgi:PPOX class probable F420-dependent enzyme
VFYVEIAPDIRDVLTSGRLAHLATINPDGSPQVSVVWCGLVDDDIAIGHMGEGRKVRNIAHDPRVALTIETNQTNPAGLAHYLIVHGTARLVDGGAPALLQKLAQIYIGPGVNFPPMENPPEGHVILITPTRFGGVGPWTA